MLYFALVRLVKLCIFGALGCFFFSSRRRHTRCREVSWARRCVQETDCKRLVGSMQLLLFDRRSFLWRALGSNNILEMLESVVLHLFGILELVNQLCLQSFQS
eukprot:TRINITY_DN24104_c0_g1_i1.p1 TRINITY_DN24104_c0_g1~~TRINITY_DN24104_c0_g1_i1.p1  ORF type:complete len:103 (-),score=19.34 TRINITY_DN24104_c0_g1_i1:134-442(-)